MPCQRVDDLVRLEVGVNVYLVPFLFAKLEGDFDGSDHLFHSSFGGIGDSCRHKSGKATR